MRTGPVSVVLGSLLVSASALASSAPAFIEATSEQDGGKPATSMWNAVDGNAATMWCSASPPGRKEALNFTFEEPTTVTHLGIQLVGKDGVADKSHRRPRVVVVADVEHRVEARFKDVADMQFLELTPPARGTRFVVEFDDPSSGASESAPLCLSEVVLKAKGKELTSGLGARARAVNSPSQKLLHQWHDDISAPMRTLTFNVDGTFSYRYAPLLDDENPVQLNGKWSAGTTSLTIEVGGKSYRLATRLTVVDSGGGGSIVLNLSGAAPHPSMLGDFSPAPMLLP